MVGYAAFSNLGNTEGYGSALNDNKNTDISSMTLQEAARQMLLGNDVFKTRDADEQSFARIAIFDNHWIEGELLSEVPAKGDRASETLGVLHWIFDGCQEISRTICKVSPWWRLPTAMQNSMHNLVWLKHWLPLIDGLFPMNLSG